MKKAQAAMEYLVTYGWAILIMLIVIGGLYYLGVFTNPVTNCSFRQSGFSCFSWKLTSNSSNFAGLLLILQQGTQDDIVVVGFNCTTNTTWNEADFDGVTTFNVTIGSNSHAPINGTTTNPRPLPCYKADGSKISSSDSGSYYKGQIYIHYYDLDTNLDHKLIGDIAGRVE